MTVSSIAGLALVGAVPPGPIPTTRLRSGLESSHKSLGVAAELFEAFGKHGLAEVTFGVAFLTSILGPLLGLGNGGPTIEDVLNKLDQMSEQLDQIKEQLDQIDSKIMHCRRSSSGDETGGEPGCANSIQTGLDVGRAHRRRERTVRLDADHGPIAAQRSGPTATVATLKEDFTAVATMAMGPNSNTPAGGPLYTAITGLHRGLVGTPVDPLTGVIHTCAEAGLLNFQDGGQEDVADDRRTTRTSRRS